MNSIVARLRISPVAHRGLASMGSFRLPTSIKNDEFRHYAPGSEERRLVADECRKLRAAETQEIPCVVNGVEHFTGDAHDQVIPGDHGKVLARMHYATPELIREAIEGTMEARQTWMALPLADRQAVFLQAAELLANKYRPAMMASIMLGQAKTVWQAEVDGAVELVDFWRFAAIYAEKIYEQQAPINPDGQWNRTEYRPLDGFVAAISPFNFTAIGGNLVGSPAIMGNGVVWKPTDTAVHSNYLTYKILEEAGLPKGVIQFLPSDGPTFGDTVMNHASFAGLHFTGSTQTFQHLYKQAAMNIDKYGSYPRIVGETGGKDFHMVHNSADMDNVVAQTIRGAFEYQGQKCSATSRAFVPATRFDEFMDKMKAEMAKLTMGQADDFSSFLSAVIDAKSFANAKSYIEHAKNASDARVAIGGTCDDSKGYFVEPTVIVADSPHYQSMTEEIFAPVLSVYKYDDDKFDETLEIVDSSTKYALTGSIFASDRDVIAHASDKLRFAAGNFYINDKCTGSMVGQQPFGGSRLSGTNDKSGAMLNLLRWTSSRGIKENFVRLAQDGWSVPSVSSEA